VNFIERKKGALNDTLLGVVARVGKNARVEATSDPITTCDDDPVFPCFNEVVLQEYFPLRMNEFTVTKRHEGLTWRLSRGGLSSSEFLKTIRKLRDKKG